MKRIRLTFIDVSFYFVSNDLYVPNSEPIRLPIPGLRNRPGLAWEVIDEVNARIDTTGSNADTLTNREALSEISARVFNPE